MKLLRLIKTDFNRMFLRKKFYLSVFSVVIICFISLIEDMEFTASLGSLGNVYYYVVSKDGLGAFFMALTVICSIPFSDSYAEDCKDGYLTSILSRCDASAYCTSKVFVTAVSGFLTVFIGYFLFFGSLSFFTDLYPKDAVLLQQAIEQTRYGELLAGKFPWLYFMLEFATEAMGYGFLAVVALLVSVFTKNILIIISSPIVFYYLFSAAAFLFDFPGWMYWFNVMNNSFIFFRGDPYNHMKVFFGTSSYFGVCILICGFLFYKKVNGREVL